MKVLFTIFKPNGYIWLQEEEQGIANAAMLAHDFLKDQPPGWRVELRVIES